MLIIVALFLLPLVARAALFAFSDGPRSWRDADWSSVGTLPAAAAHPDARVLVLTGRAGGWKGVFAVHSWVVFKRANAPGWTRYDVVGWGNPVRMNNWAPDGRWYGSPPVAIADIKGEAAEKLIPQLEAAVRDYRFANNGDYRVWPGPNSNTFVAAMLRAIPGIRVSLPSNAVGRDYPAAGLFRPDRQQHRHRGQSLWRSRFEDRLGRRDRIQHARPRRRPRPAPAGAEIAGLRPHRNRHRNGDCGPCDGAIGASSRRFHIVLFASAPAPDDANGSACDRGFDGFPSRFAAVMRDPLPLLDRIAFPAIKRGRLDTLQINVGYRCNQSCVHCHVAAGPNRTEEMSAEIVDLVLTFIERRRISTLDITGGAPELNPHFRRLVVAARDMGARVIDRCNLTILEVEGHADLAGFLAAQQVEIIASMPCYLEDNVERQRGKGAFDASIRGLQRLNALGYGRDESGLALNLVYNPQGPSLPPPQAALEADYRCVLGETYGIVFNRLYTMANMPIQRFGSMLISKGLFDDYMALLQGAHLDANLDGVMCRNLISVDYRGYVFDCDFNQMLDLALTRAGRKRVHLSDILHDDLAGDAVRVAGHCFGCTAGQGSSCGGALKEAAE